MRMPSAFPPGLLETDEEVNGEYRANLMALSEKIAKSGLTPEQAIPLILECRRRYQEHNDQQLVRIARIIHAMGHPPREETFPPWLRDEYDAMVAADPVEFAESVLADLCERDPDESCHLKASIRRRLAALKVRPGPRRMDPQAEGW